MRRCSPPSSACWSAGVPGGAATRFGVLRPTVHRRFPIWSRAYVGGRLHEAVLRRLEDSRPSRRDPDRALLRPTSTKPHSVVDLPPLREQGRAPSRSWTEAAMTGTTKSRLRASTAVCRLRPHLLVGVPPSVDDGGGLGRRGPTTSRSRLRSAR